jgi:hypothetical protein
LTFFLFPLLSFSRSSPFAFLALLAFLAFRGLLTGTTLAAFPFSLVLQVHGDPHPGNLLVRRAPGDSGIAKGGSSSAGVSRQPQPPQLVLLDHGLYRDLGESFRANYCSLWTSFITGDAQRLVAAASALDIRPEYHELLRYTFLSLSFSL